MRPKAARALIVLPRAGFGPVAAVLALCCAIWVPAPASAERQPQVLVINSGDTTLPAGVAIINGLTAKLSGRDSSPEIYVEYLDGYRFPLDEASARLERTLIEKYSGRPPPDLLVAIGTEALDFFEARRGLFGETTPIALGGTLSDVHPGVPPRPHVAGILGRVFIGRTIELAARLQPKASRLYVVAGAAPLDRRLLAVASEHLAAASPRFDVIELAGLPLPDLVAALKGVPSDAIVLYLTMFRDSDNTTYTSATVAEVIAEASPAPVYSLYDTTIGRGVVAGYMDRLYMIGEQLGDIALRILDGEDAGAIGILESATPATVVDWPAFEEAGLDAALLPPAAVVLNRPLSPWETYRPQIVGVLVVLLGLTALLVALLWERRRRLKSENSLRALTGSVLSARDEERRRIARELHDATGQNITVAGLMLGRIRQELPAAAQPGADELAGILSTCMREIRTLSYVLHPPLLDEAGLRSALPHYIEEFSKRSGIAVGIDIDRAVDRLSPDAEITLFRVVQEGLTNISRHSGSGAANIRLWKLDGIGPPSVMLRIEDEGRGFPGMRTDATVRPVTPSASGVGLASMEERLRQLGGRLRIVSGAGSTVVTAEVPIADLHAAAAE